MWKLVRASCTVDTIYVSSRRTCKIRGQQKVNVARYGVCGRTPTAERYFYCCAPLLFVLHRLSVVVLACKVLLLYFEVCIQQRGAFVALLVKKQHSTARHDMAASGPRVNRLPSFCVCCTPRYAPQINGQYQPILPAQPGEAMRVRIVHAGNNDHLYISIQASSRENSGESGEAYADADDQAGSTTVDAEAGTSVEGGDGDGEGAPGNCTLLTLARDGVYLPAPRLQGGGGGGGGHLVLAPGSRADVALLCDRPGVYRLFSSKGGEDEEEEGPVMDYLGNDTDVFEGEM